MNSSPCCDPTLNRRHRVWERWRCGGPQLSHEHSAELEARLGHPRWIRRLPGSPRSEVWLAEFDGSPAVVKHVLDDRVVDGRVGDGRVGDGRVRDGPVSDGPVVGEPGAQAQERYGREVTALRLAARVHPAVVANLLAALPAARLLVLERLTDRRPRSGWALPWAVGLARLHASTGPVDAGALPAWCPTGTNEVTAFLELATAWAVPVPRSVPGELGRLVVRLHESGGHALLHGHPGPGHDRYEGGTARFLDLEAAALGCGLVELARLRIGFPGGEAATGPLPAELLAAESAYRQVYRSAAGTEPAGDLADACAGWLISGDTPAGRARASIERARPGVYGSPSTELRVAATVPAPLRRGPAAARRRLVHRLTVVAGLGAERDDLAGLARLCLAMRARMNDRRRGNGSAET